MPELASPATIADGIRKHTKPTQPTPSSRRARHLFPLQDGPQTSDLGRKAIKLWAIEEQQKRLQTKYMSCSRLNKTEITQSPHLEVVMAEHSLRRYPLLQPFPQLRHHPAELHDVHALENIAADFDCVPVEILRVEGGG